MARPIYAAVVEANRRAQVSVCESLGIPVPDVLRDEVKYLNVVRARVRRTAGQGEG
jgi:hypothetical protein